MRMIRVAVYTDARGRMPFERWFNRLDPLAASKVTTAVTRMELGNLSNVKSVGRGVWERRIDFGPGYRIYFGRDGEELIVLLGGGTKRRQQNDIENAWELWEEYKQRKKLEV